MQNRSSFGRQAWALNGGALRIAMSTEAELHRQKSERLDLLLNEDLGLARQYS